MNTETMTIHKALAELKIIDDRITSAIHERPFVTANKHSNVKIGGIVVSEYCEQMKSAHQKVTDLIARRNAMKRAVVLSNAKTEVDIGGKRYTVAEAIDMKNHGMEMLSNLLSKMRSDYLKAQSTADRENTSLESRADEHVKNMYSGCDIKNPSEEMKKTRADFLASQVVELVDPLKVKEKIDALTAEIDAFMVEVDAALSVSNAVTTIEFSYGEGAEN